MVDTHESEDEEMFVGIKVEVFSSPGCGKCGRAKEVLRRIVQEMDCAIQWREVNVLDELDYAVALGVMSTPAIAIDGKLVFSGLPSPRKLRAVLDERLNSTAGEKP